MCESWIAPQTTFAIFTAPLCRNVSISWRMDLQLGFTMRDPNRHLVVSGVALKEAIVTIAHIYGVGGLLIMKDRSWEVGIAQWCSAGLFVNTICIIISGCAMAQSSEFSRSHLDKYVHSLQNTQRFTYTCQSTHALNSYPLIGQIYSKVDQWCAEHALNILKTYTVPEREAIRWRVHVLFPPCLHSLRGGYVRTQRINTGAQNAIGCTASVCHAQDNNNSLFVNLLPGNRGAQYRCASLWN